MSEYRTCKSLGKYKEIITKKYSLNGFLKYLRWKYIEAEVKRDSSLNPLLKNLNININKLDNRIQCKNSNFQRIIDKEKLNWGDWKFHLSKRIHLNLNSSEDDFKLFTELVGKRELSPHLKKIILEGVETDYNKNGIFEKNFYDLSILPLNLLLDKSVLKYFIPPEDYFDPHYTKKIDPYGIILGKSRANIGKGKHSVILHDKSHAILGSHKFSHTFLFNIDFYCPMGCAGCYKTRMGTREYIDPQLLEKGLTPQVFKHSEFGVINPPSQTKVEFQAKNVVKWMNNTARGKQVYDMIISGGEPLWLSNAKLESIFREFRKAKNLKVLRICTGTLFLGSPFCIDNELLDMIEDLCNETGIRFTIQAHLGNHYMISPESVFTVRKIRKRGINIYSQIPIQNGINFFINDIDKTLEYLIELGKKQLIAGIEPYMFIADMHPRTNSYYVPIELLMQVWSMLVESHYYPGLERPRTLSVLFENGNIILSGHTLFAAKKKIDRKNQRVIYYIPRLYSNDNWNINIPETYIYDEPLIEGINDDSKSLLNLNKYWERIYYNLKQNKI